VPTPRLGETKPRHSHPAFRLSPPRNARYVLPIQFLVDQFGFPVNMLSAYPGDFVEHHALLELVRRLPHMLHSESVVYFGGAAKASSRAGFSALAAVLPRVGDCLHVDFSRLIDEVYSNSTPMSSLAQTPVLLIHGINTAIAVPSRVSRSMELLSTAVDTRVRVGGLLTLLAGSPWEEAIRQMPPIVLDAITDSIDVSLRPDFQLYIPPEVL